MSIFDLLRINGRDMWQVENPEFCLVYEEEEIIDEADQKAIYDEMKWDE